MTVLERLDSRLDDVSRRAEGIRPGHTLGHLLVLLFGGLFFALGWAAGRLMFGIRWVIAAFMEGYDHGRRVSNGPAGTD
jgi:hypothetical protein